MTRSMMIPPLLLLLLSPAAMATTVFEVQIEEIATTCADEDFRYRITVENHLGDPHAVRIAFKDTCPRDDDGNVLPGCTAAGVVASSSGELKVTTRRVGDSFQVAWEDQPGGSTYSVEVGLDFDDAPTAINYQPAMWIPPSCCSSAAGVFVDLGRGEGGCIVCVNNKPQFANPCPGSDL
ncbi:MAG: hypothetical protein AAF533_15290 [Acidobacteriota bacterium]